MTRKRQLVAGVTASGALLCLTLSADGATIAQNTATNNARALALRVQDLRDKLHSGFPENDARGKEIKNIVQFFNFNNCTGCR